jgi:hypothetical protein
MGAAWHSLYFRALVFFMTTAAITAAVVLSFLGMMPALTTVIAPAESAVAASQTKDV